MQPNCAFLLKFSLRKHSVPTGCLICWHTVVSIFPTQWFDILIFSKNLVSSLVNFNLSHYLTEKLLAKVAYTDWSALKVLRPCTNFYPIILTLPVGCCVVAVLRQEICVDVDKHIEGNPPHGGIHWMIGLGKQCIKVRQLQMFRQHLVSQSVALNQPSQFL